MVSISPYVSGVFGLLGALVGGFTAGGASLLVARHAREAAERSWMRDNRREIYDRFLTAAQRLLIVCESLSGRAVLKGSSLAADDAQTLEAAYAGFFESYVVVQTVANAELVDSSRTYAYRLW